MATASTRSVARNAAKAATKAAKTEKEKPAKPAAVNLNHPEIVAGDKANNEKLGNELAAREKELERDYHYALGAAQGAFDPGDSDQIVGMIRHQQEDENKERKRRKLAPKTFPDKIAPTIVTRYRRVYELGMYPCVETIFDNFKSMQISVRGAYAVCVALKEHVKKEFDGDASKLRKAPSIDDMQATVDTDNAATHGTKTTTNDKDHKKRPAKFAERIEDLAVVVEDFADKWLCNDSYFNDENRKVMADVAEKIRSLASAAQRADKINGLVRSKKITAKKALAAYAEIAKAGKTKNGKTVH